HLLPRLDQYQPGRGELPADPGAGRRPHGVSDLRENPQATRLRRRTHRRHLCRPGHDPDVDGFRPVARRDPDVFQCVTKSKYAGGRMKCNFSSFILPPASLRHEASPFMNVLLTGGYGCIGSWITSNLLARENRVWIYDLKEDPQRMRLIMDEAQIRQVAFVQGDVTDLPRLRDVLQKQQITHIVHLAGLQVPTCRADPLLGAKVNVLGTL